MANIKPQKNSPKVTLRDLQQDKTTLEREKRSPVYFYNNFIRKQGQPVLSEIEYNVMMRAQYNKRKSEPGETQFVFVDDKEEPNLLDSIRPYQDAYDSTMNEINLLVGEPKKK